jgi:hypothetical protein
MVLVIVYLVAIIVANLSVAMFGPSVVILNALVLIGLDLTARDRLHEQWHGRLLWPKMAALICAGSLLSYLLNRSAGPIALASCVAFALSSLADTVVYAALGRQSWFTRVNGSNVVSAAVDSVVFPTLAFGVWLPWIVLGQWLAKVIGGACWAYVLRRHRARLVPV